MKRHILFLCTGNSCRSQMAEGWARHLKSDSIEAYSAGTESHGLNPYAVAVMKEVGVDISHNESKQLETLDDVNFDCVVAVCTHAANCCPNFQGEARVICRSFDDPPKLAESAESEAEKLACYRRVRDEIRRFVEGIPGSLD